MKMKSISWLVNMMLIISILLFPATAKAESNCVNLPTKLTQIELTSSQQNQLQTIREKTHSQVKNLMSAEQQAQLKDVCSAIQSLNLSLKQRQEIASILHSMKTEVSKILTPEQKYQILGGTKKFS
jgi:hypothetical protein